MKGLPKPNRALGLIQHLAASAVLAPVLVGALSSAGLAQSAQKSLRFVVIPKLNHPWFDAVRSGAQQAVAMIEQQSRAAAVLDYRPPAKAEAALQAEILQGVPTEPNHAIRAHCHRQVFAQHPGIKVVASPIDQDSIPIAEQEATATMRRHPQLRGWVVSDAGGGIGVGRAIAALGKTGSVKVVALDDLPEQVQLINSGVVDSTAASKPRSQGYWAVLSLWQQSLGAPPIERIDTGIGVQGAGVP